MGLPAPWWPTWGCGSRSDEQPLPHLWVNTLSILMLAIVLLPSLLCAQVDLPVFGKQQVINGYAKDVEGEVLSYFSVYPEHATTALLTRCTDGTKAIAWETASRTLLPTGREVQYFYFSWIAAHNSTTSGGDRSFDLYINDEARAHLHHAPQHEAGFMGRRR
jgi:alpha-mannosidase